MPSWASPGKVWHGTEHVEKIRPCLWRCFCNKFSDEIWVLGFETLAQQVSNISLSQREGNDRGKGRGAIKKETSTRQRNPAKL